MRATLEKKFYFGASFSRGQRVMAHNYTLGVITDPLEADAEDALVQRVRTVLIEKVDSRDLSIDVDFLKNIQITEMSLLESFWVLLELKIKPVTLRQLFLEKDDRTRLTLSKD